MEFKRVQSVGKVMTSLFCDCEGVLMIDYLQKGLKTLNREYYASNLRQLKEVIKSKRRGKLRMLLFTQHKWQSQF